MPNLNLNNSKDFSTATLSGASGVLNQLTGLNQDTWDIEEGAYGHPPGPMLLFHVFRSSVDYDAALAQIQDNVTRRVVPFKFPYVDGQTTDDLGRDGETFEIDIIIHGPNYFKAYKNLIAEFNKPQPGTLVHPVRGRITAKFTGAVVTHKSSERKAVTLRATFCEHNFELSFKAAKDTTKSALAKAVGFIAAVTNIINKIDSNLNVLSQVRAAIKGGLGNYQASYTQALVALNTTFNNGSSTDLPSLLPNNPGSGSAFPSAVAPTDPFAGTTPAQIQSQQSPALAAAQAADQVKAIRVQLLSLIQIMEQANVGQGALIFYDQILTLKQSAIAVQLVLELGLQSSNATIKSYTTPRLMTLREVCFSNGIAVDRVIELEVLNPSLLSTNFIPKGSALQVPTS